MASTGLVRELQFELNVESMPETQTPRGSDPLQLLLELLFAEIVDSATGDESADAAESNNGYEYSDSSNIGSASKGDESVEATKESGLDEPDTDDAAEEGNEAEPKSDSKISSGEMLADLGSEQANCLSEAATFWSLNPLLLFQTWFSISKSTASQDSRLGE